MIFVVFFFFTNIPRLLAQILFVSSDRDRRSFKENYSQMPFGAIPYGDRYAKNKLAKLLNIRGIPSILIYGPKPKGGGGGGYRPLINSNIREIFEHGDVIQSFPYIPQPYGDINQTTEDIKTHRFIIVFHEAGDDHEQNEIKVAIESASRTYQENFDCNGRPIKMCYALRTSGLCESLRSVLRLGPPRDHPTLVFLDIPDSGAFYLAPAGIDVTAETILSFMESPGQRLQI